MLSSLLDGFFGWLSAHTAGHRWRAKVVGACVLAAIVGQLPPYHHTYRELVYGTELESNLQIFNKQVENPWRPYSTIDASHPAKMVFRLTLPLLARVLHLPLLGVFLLQFALGVLMYYLLVTVLARVLADRVTATLFVLGLSGTYFGSAFSYDLFGYFDAFCYALLVVVFCTQHRWLIVGLCLLGGFIDERMLLTLPVAVFWYGVSEYGWQGRPAWRYLLTKRAGAVYGAGLIYALLRLWLARHYHLPTSLGLVGFDALRDNLQHQWLSLGYVAGLKSYWLLLLVLVGLLLYRRAYGLLLVFGGCAAPIFLGSALVTDITRSVAYGGPIVLICASLLRASCTLAERRYLVLIVAALAWLIPSYHVLGKIIYQSPLHMQVLKLAVGAS